MPVINRGDDYFAAGTYTGNGSSVTITGLRFQPDFVWIKGRSGATNHALYDRVRGVQLDLVSNSTAAETTQSQGLTAFTSDGFTVGSLAKVNTNGATYVYWAWKANGAGVTNTAGSITSTVSANTTSGFSIVTYTGTGANATVGHGLGVAPEFIIGMNRDGTQNWFIYHKAIGATKWLQFTTSAAITQSAIWNDTAPTSSVVSIGVASNVGGVVGSRILMYCFAPVAGYSAFGSYTGNGSADGPFVFTGHRPRFLLVKCSSTIGNWWMIDTARSTINQMADLLLADSNDAEFASATGWPGIDFLSNGFKLRGTASGVNANGATYVFACFSENPFKYSLAR